MSLVICSMCNTTIPDVPNPFPLKWRAKRIGGDYWAPSPRYHVGRNPYGLAMSKSTTYIAFALHGGIIHLCLDSSETHKTPVRSFCREVQVAPPRARVDPDDLDNLQNFIICKGCESRFNLLGYRGHYTQLSAPSDVNPNQLALF